MYTYSKVQMMNKARRVWLRRGGEIKGARFVGTGWTYYPGALCLGAKDESPLCDCSEEPHTTNYCKHHPITA